ncbi:MAG: hypothetical protein QG604_876 [Candidatus Dependentiae bacterium]|nr:hypothetical protein [Candidatus Dependentiae bacterium]
MRHWLFISGSIILSVAHGVVASESVPAYSEPSYVTVEKESHAILRDSLWAALKQVEAGWFAGWSPPAVPTENPMARMTAISRWMDAAQKKPGKKYRYYTRSIDLMREAIIPAYQDLTESDYKNRAEHAQEVIATLKQCIKALRSHIYTYAAILVLDALDGLCAHMKGKFVDASMISLLSGLSAELWVASQNPDGAERLRCYKNVQQELQEAEDDLRSLCVNKWVDPCIKMIGVLASC